MARLFISDMDGTLLGMDSRVSEESAEIISRLSREGAWFTVATARTPATVVPLMASTFTTLPAIVMTGAALWDRNAGKFLETRLFEPEVARKTVESFLKYGINPFVYTVKDVSHLEVFHNGTMSRREENFYLDRKDMPLKRFVFDREKVYLDPPASTILLLGIGSNRSIFPLAEFLRANYDVSVSAYSDPINRSIAYIEVFAPGVSKSEAVKRLAERIGADGITVYGDNINDISMMEVADDAVAVANALPEVIDIADRVIGPNTESSVARDFLRICEEA
ncbi:MAG: HAD family hydrolase [Duncaniella sp.]|nr:HAD family hydrolase [Duncaniella sp.]